MKQHRRPAPHENPAILGSEKDTAIATIVVWPEEGIDAWSVSAYNAANEQIGETLTERKRQRAVKVGQAQAKSLGAELSIEGDEGGGLLAALAGFFRQSAVFAEPMCESCGANPPVHSSPDSHAGGYCDQCWKGEGWPTS